jgi:hypothetical protein
MKAPKRNLGDKLQEIGRRSRKHLAALEVLVDSALEGLPPEDPSTTPYDWRCDKPAVVDRTLKGGPK